jgi:Pyridoxamine 5'-phosphate oxidase
MGYEPVAELDARFSAEGATATGWAQARGELQNAQVSWLSTVRADGRPHVTPVLTVWLDDALYFTTGPAEQKAHNLARNAHVAVTTGSATLGSGLDLVVEGAAVLARDDGKLRHVADAFTSKYGSDWRFTVRDGTLFREGGDHQSVVYEVAPSTIFGFSKGKFSQTRWRFQRG